MLFSRQLPNGSHNFFQTFSIYFQNYFTKNPQTTITLAFLTHNIWCELVQNRFIKNWCEKKETLQLNWTDSNLSICMCSLWRQEAGNNLSRWQRKQVISTCLKISLDWQEDSCCFAPAFFLISRENWKKELVLGSSHVVAVTNFLKAFIFLVVYEPLCLKKSFK